MTLVSSTLADWLRSQALVDVVDNASVALAWGEDATEANILTPYATKADASAEGARWFDFFDRPVAVETVEVPGYRADLLGKPHTIAGDEANYADVTAVFVIGVDELSSGRTVLTVLRPMEGL